jgi:multidrug efflux pump subunit AcrA (membrane-fusion protein)/YHS domain-containing protein
MKKPSYFLLLSIALIISFVGGIRFNQFGASHSTTSVGSRQILHYVDPMNPGNTSEKPGIAPCGMPMEPVYADAPLPGNTASAASGSVKINSQKQQVIGVQTAEVLKTSATSTIRALGRIVPDENQVYALITATDGWIGEVHESTTGSSVAKDQLLAKIKIFNYDFYTWQQRYLTELGNAGRRRVFLSTTSGAAEQLEKIVAEGKKAGAALTDVGGPIALPSEPPIKKTVADKIRSIQEPPAMATALSPLPNPSEDHLKHQKNMAPEKEMDLPLMREDDILYASKARQELLNFGVGESQLAQLAKTGVYVTYVELRSPVDGLVLARNVTPRQKISRGAECFRVADLSKVWIEADLYDFEAKYIQPGTLARISLPGQPQRLTAMVSETLPRFDATTRTLKVRLEMDNPENNFRPDMFVDVQFQVQLPESIVVPSAALINSGKMKTVYVVMGEGIFEPRMVMTGWQFNDQIEIVQGLQPGETIVVSGNFLIDSESRMKLAAAKLMTDPSTVPTIPVATAALSQPPTPTKENRAGWITAKDPICGMTVDPDSASKAGLAVTKEGKTYYFCSQECVDEFHRHGPQVRDSKAPKTTPADTPNPGAHHHD